MRRGRGRKRNIRADESPFREFERSFESSNATSKAPESRRIGVFLGVKSSHSIGCALIIQHTDEHGWANVDELIDRISKTHEISMDILEEIVSIDNKRRYSFNEDKTFIRANQGHSIPVDIKLEEKEPPELLWHGTGDKIVDSIDRQGLISKSRLYVHLSKDEETALSVGKRNGAPVLYRVKARQMYNDGYKSYLSVNGVWLTTEVPTKYFEKKHK